ncbi:CoA ester lyase [Ammoniphilus sp. 3BR4]|uniref:HpcH/HpaI aldolase/citrate lyase family protein n=1 Tax=Ammoniphilus sp. 3BR4 TaxID=3158265 RepID=UPI0034677058
MALIRSWMFVPGSDSKKIGKVQQLPADVIIFDLEDAVALAEKESARKKVKEALGIETNKNYVVRVNSTDTPYFVDDVKEIVGEGLMGIMLPKSESREQILLLDDLLGKLEKEQGLKREIEVIPLIESALGVCRADEIASASARVKCLAFGSVDYTLDIDAELTKEGFELLYARSRLVNVSRAAGIQSPIDAVYTDIHDLEGLRKETTFIKQMGFQGKLVVYPKQIGVVNEVFMPSREDIENAQMIVSAFEKSVKEGLGAVQVNGKMIDLPVVERAKRIVEKAEWLAGTTKSETETSV